jgi:hypothetical protein
MGAFVIVVTAVVPLDTYVDVSQGTVTVAMSVAVTTAVEVTGWHGFVTGQVVVV